MGNNEASTSKGNFKRPLPGRGTSQPAPALGRKTHELPRAAKAIVLPGGRCLNIAVWLHKGGVGKSLVRHHAMMAAHC